MISTNVNVLAHGTNQLPYTIKIYKYSKRLKEWEKIIIFKNLNVKNKSTLSENSFFYCRSCKLEKGHNFVNEFQKLHALLVHSPLLDSVEIELEVMYCSLTWIN